MTNGPGLTILQLKVLIAMDGSRSVYDLAQHAKEVAPELNFVPWLKHVAGRGRGFENQANPAAPARSCRR